MLTLQATSRPDGQRLSTHGLAKLVEQFDSVMFDEVYLSTTAQRLL